MKRVVQSTSLHPKVDEKLQEIAQANEKTVSGQIAEFVKDGVSEGRYVIKYLDPDLEAELIESAKKESRSPENLIEIALKVYLKRIQYVPVFH